MREHDKKQVLWCGSERLTDSPLESRHLRTTKALTELQIKRSGWTDDHRATGESRQQQQQQQQQPNTKETRRSSSWCLILRAFLAGENLG